MGLSSRELKLTGFYCTGEPRCNEPLYNEVLGIAKDIPQRG